MTCTMDAFKIGDRVVYTPNIPNLPPAIERIRDHGIVMGKEYGTHLVVRFIDSYGEDSLIRHEAISLLQPRQITIEVMIVPAGACDVITMDALQEGDILVDFLRTNTQYESHFDVYYTEVTFNQIVRNPFTAQMIDRSSARWYCAKLK